MNELEIPMTSLQRVLKTLSHEEPDKVPLFLLTTLHGAKELGMSIEEYYSKAEHVVKGQLLLQKKYRSDCVYPFFYAGIEVEAYGGDIIYYTDGPPNSGKPIISKREDIDSMTPPDVHEVDCLKKVFNSIRALKNEVKDEIPIIGVVMSPFSVPVMQMGFEHYIELIFEDKEKFNTLMEINQEFCVNYANAQIDAGATAIVYFDPVSSPSIISRKTYLNTGYKIAKNTISKIKGPTATHLASGYAHPILDDIAEYGTAAVGVSVFEDIAKMKEKARGKLSVIGNLNGIEMVNWTREIAEAKVKEAILKAGPGGGFILSDNHGEIPYQVPDEVLTAISDAVDKWGKYPLDWID